ncbi:indolepyruvate oxidoreductase subunit beta [Guggenheimella bovis]
MRETRSILFTGVGGQGIILASKILSSALINAGYDVKMSEVHGMAQRGGAVTTQVRFGDEVYSPIIGKGQADVLVAFEKMEAIRWIEYVKEGGKVVVNDFEIPSAPVLSGAKDYPQGINEYLKENFDTLLLDAGRLAEELGNIKTMNVIMVGAMAKALNLPDVDWEQCIRENVKEQFFDINKKAFEVGYSL